MVQAPYADELALCAGCRHESLLRYGDWLKRQNVFQWFCEECVNEAIEVWAERYRLKR